MATLALAAVGSAVGSSLLPAGVGVLGATISGATIGSQIGALAGSYIDNALFGSSGKSRSVEGPRLNDLHVTSSTEGAHIPRIYGRVRLGGQVIWATDFEEDVVTTKQSSGGGKGIGGGGGSETTSTEYRYYANVAIALCQGPISRLGRVWADGREISLGNVTYRLYKGSETQPADTLIASKEGAANAPAYRGLAYIVFQRLPLAEYGNRLPQFSFELYRNIEAGDADIKGIVLIPGSGEFVYSPDAVREVRGDGVSVPANVHTRLADTDWDAGINQLEAGLVNAKKVSFVVSWFGTDLRAGACQIRPGVEGSTKVTAPISWSVAGVTRTNAYVVTEKDGRPAYGGTPSDQTVVAAIRDLKTRGFDVTMTPFILMDVPSNNTLPDPYSGGFQAPYPWRGRITCYPGPSQAGTPDKTAAVVSQINAFVGTATPAHFALSGDNVIYSGPVEWSYRRMVLHQAYLAKAAGGVEAFLIGTELRGLTWLRSAAGTYPFVSALIAIAQDVKAILGPGTRVLYAADWSEYFGHQPSDGTGDVYFHLDPLWASSSIDAIGIDVYWPLADWRDGRSHLDYQAGYRSTYDLNYLKANVQGGEGYNWFYASPANRDNQVRSPINDSYGKPWVFRYKDIKNWWLNQHFNRPGGIESTTPTAWVPQSKPFWFMEIGCPAVDKGANQPNVFVDPKSSESAFPYYSRGNRDDLIQRRFLKAFSHAFDPAKPGYVTGLNPVSTVYSGRMADLDHIHVYCWDARPFPAFPQQLEIWGDGANWQYGHWLNGRFASAPLSETVAKIMSDYGFSDHSTGALNGTVPGYVIDRIMAVRDALEPLELAYFFDSIESGGNIVFRHRGLDAPAMTVTPDGMVEERPGSELLTLTRGQETELPASAKIRFISGEEDYEQAVAEARRLAGASGRVAQADLPIVLEDGLAAGIAETWLFESWAARERASFTLPPSALAIEPGDVVTIEQSGKSRAVRVTEISEHGAREITGRSVDPDVYAQVGAPERVAGPAPVLQIGQPAAAFLDLPLLTGTEDPEAGYAAAVQQPWPGGVAFYSSAQTSGYALRGIANAPATYGRTLDPLPAGPEGRIDWAAKVRVKLSFGTLTSADLVSIGSGVNTAAVRNADEEWEVIQFLNAALVDVGTYELSGLVRGQGGTESAMRAPVAADAVFVMLDGAVMQFPLGLNNLNLALNWRYGPSNRGIGDASYVTVPHAFRGLGLRPLSPARVKGARVPGGDLTISWERRTRIGGDSWDMADVPLSEASEAYEVEIMQGATVMRTISAPGASVLYTALQQVADFGAVQSAVSVRVYQLSQIYGRGAARVAVV